MTPDLRFLPIGKWVPIAYRSHDEATWVEVPGAVMSITLAHQLERDDLIYMAQRREATCTAQPIAGRGR